MPKRPSSFSVPPGYFETKRNITDVRNETVDELRNVRDVQKAQQDLTPILQRDKK